MNSTSLTLECCHISVEALCYLFCTSEKGESSVRFVHLWTDQRIPGPVSCRCPSGLLETPPRWHATIYFTV